MTFEPIPEFLRREKPASVKLVKERALVGSYSLFKSFSTCPYQAYRRYVIRDILYVESPEQKIGNDGHKAMELRIGGNKPLPVAFQHLEPFARVFDGRTVKVEWKMGVKESGHPVDFWDSDVWLRGTADVALIEGRKAYLADHKWASKWEDPFELKVHAVLVHARHPHLKQILGQYLWHRQEQVGELHDVSNTRETWAEIKRIRHDIDECVKTGQWRKQKNKLCAWCSVFDCENNSNPKKNLS